MCGRPGAQWIGWVACPARVERMSVTVIAAVPGHETCHALIDRSHRSEAGPARELTDIGKRCHDVAGLERFELLDGRSANGLLDGGDKSHQFDRPLIADVEYPEGRPGSSRIGRRKYLSWESVWVCS